MQHKFQIRISVMIFTLPANVRYIGDTLQQNNIYLQDPVPPYDPWRHQDQPVYENPHGGGMISAHAAQRAQQSLYAGGAGFAGSMPGYNLGSTIGQERINQVEVHRKQVDEVFTSLEVTGELDQSDPGPYIKTELFPHQRKALTFLLQREQDSSALKRGKKYAERALRKKQRGRDKAKGKEEKAKAESTATEEDKNKAGEDVQEEGGEEKASASATAPITIDDSAEASPVPDETKKVENARTLWEAIKDEKGKVRRYKNRVTGEEMKVKKGDKPPDCKGAILADDVGAIGL